MSKEDTAEGSQCGTATSVDAHRRLLRRILDASPDIIYVFELETGRNVFISGRVEEVLGRSRENIRALGGGVLAELIHPEDAERVTAHLRLLPQLADGSVTEIEYRMRTTQGSWRWLSSREVVFTRTAAGLVHSVLGIASDITARREAQEQIQELDRKMRALQEEERRRIATDLHDSTAQLLVGASLLASRLSQLVSKRAAEGLVRELKELLEQASKEIRISAFLLHPPKLQSEGLVSVVGIYVAAFAQRTGIAAETKCEGNVALIPLVLQTALLRITQEALANVHRHAFAERVEVSLKINPGEVSLKIKDNGRGMRPNVKNTGIGVLGMRTRIEGLGGTLRMFSGGGGTTVEVTAPLPM